MKTEKYFLRLVLILIVGISLFSFFAAISDDDDYSLDRLDNCAAFLSYRDIFADINSACELALESQPEVIYAQPLTSYLARYEKSPPVIS